MIRRLTDWIKRNASILFSWIKRGSIILFQWTKSPYILICLIDLVLSNFWEFWRDKKSAKPLYVHQEGWMDWFYLDLFSTYMRPLLTPIMFITWYITRIIPDRKHVWFVAIYFVMLIKDAFDFIQDGNRSALVFDFVVFLITIFVCEVINRITENDKTDV